MTFSITNSNRINIGLNATDHYRITPRVILAVYPFANANVRPVQVITNKDKDSYSVDNYIKLEDDSPIIITDDCISLNFRSSKSNFEHDLSAVLVPGNYEYLSYFDPGDYVFAWLINDESIFDQVVDNIKNKKSANFYNSGLVFFGQIENLAENFAIDSRGLKQLRYSLSAKGFKPYGANIMWSPFVLGKEGDQSTAQLELGQALFEKLDTVVSDASTLSDSSPYTYVQKLIEILHKAYLGGGTDEIKGDESGGVINRDYSDFFRLPGPVASVFGKNPNNSSADGSTISYAQILNCLIGVQKFESSSTDGMGPGNLSAEDDQDKFGTYFVPSIQNQWLKGNKVLNMTPNITGTVISLLQEYSNSLINELYVTLRLDPKNFKDRGILPTFIARQIPFFKDKDAKFDGSFEVTYFTELPRFVIDPKIIRSYSFSKSDTLRLNAFSLLPRPIFAGQDETLIKAQQLANRGYYLDLGDIKKNGLKMFQAVLNTDLINTAEQTNSDSDKSNAEIQLDDYLKFIIDVNANLHTKLSGVIELPGIQEPICVGENVQIGQRLMHIESVNHRYSIDFNGKPTFATSLEVSHGVTIDKKQTAVASVFNDDDSHQTDEIIIESFNQKNLQNLDFNKDVRGFDIGIVNDSVTKQNQ